MKIEKRIKTSFSVIGKEGSTLGGMALFRNYGRMQILILKKFSR